MEVLLQERYTLFRIGVQPSAWAQMTKWERTVLNAFWTPQYDATLHLGPPHVATFRELIAPSGNADHVSDLLSPQTMDPQAARAKLGDPLGPAVDDVDRTIAAFLDAL